MNNLHETPEKQINSLNVHEKWSMYRSGLQKHLQTSTHVCCDFCNKKFTSNYSLKRHITLHTEKRHYCNFCPKNFSSRFNLQKHLKKHFCNVCKKLFASFSELKQHSISHIADKPHCNVDQRLLVSNISFSDHTNKSECAIYVCSLCKKQFISIIGLITHKDSCEGKKAVSLLPNKELEEKEVCTNEKHHTVNAEILPNIKSYSQEIHNNIVLIKVRKLLCKICNKLFSNKAQLDTHTCTQSSNAYAKWLAFRSGEKKINSLTNCKSKLCCKICRKHFYSEAYLRHHYLTHNNHISIHRIENILHHIKKTTNIMNSHSAHINPFSSILNKKECDESCSEKKLTNEVFEKEESCIGEKLCNVQIKNEPESDSCAKEYFIPLNKVSEEVKPFIEDKFLDVVIKNEPEEEDSCTEEEFHFVLTKKISEEDGKLIEEEHHNVFIKNEPEED